MCYAGARSSPAGPRAAYYFPRDLFFCFFTFKLTIGAFTPVPRETGVVTGCFFDFPCHVDPPLVNGASKPHFDVEPRKYRLRFLNAANFRTYDLSVAYSELIAPLTKLPMIQIANESGLLPTSGLRTHTVLGPAERAEFVVDFSGLDGQRMYLEGSWCNKPESSGEEELPPCSRGETSRKLMEFRVSEGPVANSAPVPAQLRSVSAFQVPAEVDKEWVFGFGSHPWGINGEGFDPSNVAHDIPLGKVERWRFTLYGPSPPHIVHVHAGDFLVLSDPFNPANAGTLKETILLTHAGPVDVAVRFADHRGIFVLHCHMLEHEDRAMMAQFEVTNPP